jgi:hypothetical protein
MAEEHCEERSRGRRRDIEAVIFIPQAGMLINLHNLILNFLDTHHLLGAHYLLLFAMESTVSSVLERTLSSSSLSSFLNSTSDQQPTLENESQDTESNPGQTSTRTGSSSVFGSTQKQPLSWVTAQQNPNNKRTVTSWIYKHGISVKKEGGNGTRY